MTAFFLVALVINLSMLGLLFGARKHIAARLPMPGLWWLAVITADIVLTVQSAQILLS